jgi:DNA-binding transcriptional regulator YhcF (GntR family)
MAVPLSPLREAIDKQTAKEMIRDKIVSPIASGILQLGDKLPSERELARMLLVSRETVRGAIQRLAGEESFECLKALELGSPTSTSISINKDRRHKSECDQ